MLYSDGYIIIKSVGNNDNFLVMDPETGIVRDINTVNNYCGAYCFHDQLTGQSHQLSEDVSQGTKHFNWKKAAYWGCVMGGIAVGVALACLFPPAGAGVLYYSLVAAGAGFGLGTAYFGDPCANEGWYT